MSKTLFLLTAGLALSACASYAQESPAIESIVPKGQEQAYNDFHYSPAIRAGDTVYLSGVVASLRDGETDADMAAAFERAFVDIDTVLEAAGVDWSDIVEIETFHTELLPQIQAFTAVKDKWIKEPYPAWTALDIDGLYLERGLVEIKVTAYSPQ